MQTNGNNPSGLDASATPTGSSTYDPYGLNGFGSFCAYNIDLWIRNDELAHSLWQFYKSRLGQFTPRTARPIARAIFGEKTPDNVRIHNRAIDWQEIAAMWNSHE